MNFSIYEPDIVRFITGTRLIPRKIKSSKEIRRYGKYISLQQATEGFKIEEIIEIGNDLYYQIRFLTSGRQAVVPYEDTFIYYELFQDKNDLKSTPTIINTDIPYYGSEIKYWFFIHNYDLSSNKFYNFKSLIIDSKHMIADNKLYCLYGTYLESKDKYVDCKVVLYVK